MLLPWAARAANPGHPRNSPLSSETSRKLTLKRLWISLWISPYVRLNKGLTSKALCSTLLIIGGPMTHTEKLQLQKAARERAEKIRAAWAAIKEANKGKEKP